MYLETLVGGPGEFEPWLKLYLKDFAGKTLVTDDFVAHFKAHFAPRCPEALARVDWDTWLYAPGMPPAVNEFDDTLARQAKDLAARWHAADVMGVGGVDAAQFAAADVEGWSSEQTVAFLSHLADLRAMKALHPTTARAMGELYGLDASRNAEIRFAWCKTCVAAEDEAALPDALAFLREQGRMKYVRPLFRALAASRMGKGPAAELFAEIRAQYHPVCEKMVARDLGM